MHCKMTSYFKNTIWETIVQPQVCDNRGWRSDWTPFRGHGCLCRPLDPQARQVATRRRRGTVGTLKIWRPSLQSQQFPTDSDDIFHSYEGPLRLAQERALRRHGTKVQLQAKTWFPSNEMQKSPNLTNEPLCPGPVQE